MKLQNLFIFQKIIIFLFILFYGSLLFAGDTKKEARKKWNTLNLKATESFNQKNYKTGVSEARKTLTSATRQFGENDPDTVSSMNNLASVYAYSRFYDKAEFYYKKALTCLKKSLGENDLKTITTFQNLAYLNLLKKNYKNLKYFRKRY